MLNQSEIAARLKKVRKQCRITEGEVAGSLGLSRENVAELENGQRPVSAHEIRKLSEIYWCDAVFFLSEDHELSKDDLPVFLHREFSKLKLTPEIKAALWQLFDLYAEITILKETLNQTTPPKFPDYSTPGEDKFIETDETVPVDKDTETRFVAKGVSTAKEERLRLGIESGPVPNVAELINKQNIWTAAVKLPDELGGLFVKHSDVGSIILVNQQDSPECKRFTYLHEFAHALFDRSDRPVMMAFFYYYYYYLEPRKSRRDLPEIRASSFAEEFLMPEKSVAKELEQLGMGHLDLQKKMDVVLAGDRQNQAIPQRITYQNTAALAHHFGVDYKTMVQRLVNLKYIDSTEKEYLNKKNNARKKDIAQRTCHELSKNSASSACTEEEPDTLLLQLACEAFKKEKISRGRFIEIGGKVDTDYFEMFELLKDQKFSDRA